MKIAAGELSEAFPPSFVSNGPRETEKQAKNEKCERGGTFFSVYVGIRILDTGFLYFSDFSFSLFLGLKF